MSRTDPPRPGPEPEGKPPLDRTQAYDPRAGQEPPPLPADVPKIPGITLNYELARGGMGVVYSGRQDFLDRRVAVKLLSRDLAGEKFAQRFRREAKILAGIKHPHIVACHAAGTTDDGQSYLVMEFVDGPNLKTWIADHGAVSPAAALRLTKALGQALGHAHLLEVIHRDVKPENILLESITSTAIDVSFPFVPKLVDLGLARMTTETVGFGLTSPGAVMGTPTTMSPEQFDDPDSVDFRTDIYGLGCVLYEMLVGAPAYRGNKLTEIVTKKRQPVGPNPCAENPAVPAAVGALVCSMLAAERDERPRSYKDLDERIEALLASLPAHRPSIAAPKRTPPVTTEFTMPSQQGIAPTAPPKPGSSSPGNGPPSGPGLLRTAELDFLQEGLGSAQRTQFQESEPKKPASPFAEPAASVVPASPPTAPTPAPPPPPTPVAAPAKKGRTPLVAAAAVVVLAGSGAAWMTLRGGGNGEAPIEPPSKNAPPTVAIEVPERAMLMQFVALEAKAADADGDRLTYSWTSSTPEVTFRNQSRPSAQAMITDGLPGETFAIECAIGDGKNRAVVVSKSLTVDEAEFPKRQFLLGYKGGDSRWVFEPPEVPVPAWNWRTDVPSDWLSCRSLGALRTMTLQMPNEAFWKVEGRLGSRRDDADPNFGETIVRLETGETGWSLHCTRAGDEGEKWAIELRKAKLVGGLWLTDPIAPARKVEWVEGENATESATEAPFAGLSITRRRETLQLRFGRFEANKVDEFEVAIPENSPLPKLALSVNGGAGEFRSFTIW